MKETTKKKLKKVAKVLAIVFGGVFATIGVICSAALLSKCGSAADQNKPVILADRPKAVPAPSGLSASGHWEEVAVVNFDSTSIYLNSPLSGFDIYKYVIPSDGVYVIDFIGNGLFFSLSASADITHMDYVLGQCELEGGRWSVLELTSLSLGSGDNSSYRLFQLEAGSCLYVNSYPDSTYWVGAMQDRTPLFSVSWPYNWFPWQLMGTSASNPFILSSEYGSLDHLTYNVEFGGFYFVCNGKLYDKIEFRFDWAGSNGSVWTDGAGQYFHIEGDNHYLWTLAQVRYWHGSDFDIVMDMSLFPSPDGNYGLPAYGPVAWVSPAFRDISFVWVYNPSATYTTITGTYTLRQWIDIIMNPSGGSVSIEGGSVGEPFDLFSNAFTSVLPILSINVLPNITLGLLIFLPIIAGIIVVIVRVVKK